MVGPPSVVLALQWHNHLSHLMNLPLVYIYSMLAMDMKAYSRVSASDQETVENILDEVFEFGCSYQLRLYLGSDFLQRVMLV